MRLILQQLSRPCTPRMPQSMTFLSRPGQEGRRMQEPLPPDANQLEGGGVLQANDREVERDHDANVYS
jgi:hypothetical protein